MKLIFFGSSGFSVPFLKAIHDSTHTIVKVITGPDKKKGRGREKRPNPVKEYALKNNLEIISFERFDSDNILLLNSLRFDFAVVVSFGKMIPLEVLDSKDFINVHPSYLPKYRGPSPIESTLLCGEESTATTIINISEKMDAGDILSQLSFGIYPGENKESLEKKHITFGKSLLMGTLYLLEKNSLSAIPQAEEEATYTHLFTKSDYRIDWDAGAEKVVNKIRAFSREPGAFSYFKDKMIKILEASFENKTFSSGKKDIVNGQVIEADKKNGLLVLSGDGLVRITRLKPQGKNEMGFKDFLNGYQIRKDDRFL